jgi:hypothetical protein
VAGDLARGLGAAECRIKARGVSPNGAELVLNGAVSKMLQHDDAVSLVWEGAVGAALAGEVAEEFEGAADVASDEERRSLMVGGQAGGVVPCLIEGGAHIGVPGRAAGLCRAGRKLVGLCDDRLALVVLAERVEGKPALLRLQDERASLVQVDAQGLGAVATDGKFEPVGASAVGRLRRRQIEGAGQLGQEERIVGPLGAALPPCPSRDEFSRPHAVTLSTYPYRPSSNTVSGRIARALRTQNAAAA